MISYRALAKHACQDWKHTLWRFLDATVIPLAFFTITAAMFNVWSAMATSTAWTCGRLIYRRHRGEPAGTLVISAVVQVIRLAVAIVLMSPKAWAFQGVAQTAAGGAVLVATSVRGQASIVGAAVSDATPWVRRLLGGSHSSFSRTISIVWGVEQIVLAAANLLLATRLSLQTFMLVKPVLGWLMATPALLLSVRTLRRNHQRYIQVEPA